MPVYSICPSCNTGYDLDDALRGKRVICQTCNDSFLVQETLRAPAALAVPVAVPAPNPPAAPLPLPTADYYPVPYDYPEVLPATPPGHDPQTASHPEWDRLPRRRSTGRPPQERGLSTGAIVALVLIPVGLLVALTVVLVIALTPRNSFDDWRDDRIQPVRPIVRPGVAPPIIIPPPRFNNPAPPRWNPPRVNPPRVNPPRVRFR
jgi:hypothetical protein